MLARARYGDRLVAFSRAGNRDGIAAYFDLDWLVVPEEIPPTNAPLDIELILHEGREFDFLIAPDEAIQTTAIAP